MSVLMVYNDNVNENLKERYYEAQTTADKKYAMATIRTQQGALLIEGHRPRVVVVD